MGIEHQLQRYIVYSCKKCGWQTAILAQWADLKPKKCLNKKCKCVFIREPEQLDVKVPKEEQKNKKPPSAVYSKNTKASRKKISKKKAGSERRKDEQGRDKEEGRSEDSSLN